MAYAYSIICSKSLSRSNETQKGHMHQTKQGVCSTKQNNDENKPQVIYEPQPRVQEIQVKVEDIKHIMYTNQTGQYLVMSSQGNR